LQNVQKESEGTKAALSAANSLNTDLNRKIAVAGIDSSAQVPALTRRNRELQTTISTLQQQSPKSGFVTWQGTGKGKVTFRQNADGSSGPDRGFVEGSFPRGQCLVEKVLGEHVKDSNKVGNPECQKLDFYVDNKSGNTAYILWRLR
jgi:hypothetical protein